MYAILSNFTLLLFLTWSHVYKSSILPLMLFISSNSVAVLLVMSWNDVFFFGNEWEIIREVATEDWPGKGTKTTLVTTRTSWIGKRSSLLLFSILWLMFTSCWFVLIYPISLVIAIVDVKMVSTRKKKQRNKKFLNQMSGRDTDFWLGKATKMSKSKVEIAWYVDVLFRTI